MKQPRARGSDRRHIADLHAQFLVILPRIELHDRIHFRALTPDKKDEVIQEMRALAWRWFLGHRRRNKNPADFLKTFTSLLARDVFNGRRLIGCEKAKDVMTLRLGIPWMPEFRL